MKKVLVIVVSYNGVKWLERCLGSVTGDAVSVPGMAVDVYVWDNDSTDGSADFVASHFPSARLIRSAENLGFSIPNNKGMEYALQRGYDYVYLLNQDAWLEKGALETLVAAAEANPEYAVLSPLQMTDGFKELDRQFAKRAGFGGDTLSRTVASRPLPPAEPAGPSLLSGRGWPEVPERVSPPKPVPFVMAAHWLVRVEALTKTGLFNETLFPFYGQDDDWCNRARYHGYKIGVVPAARAVHDRAERPEPLDKTVFRNYYNGSLVRLCNVNRPLWLQFLWVLAFTLVKTVKYRSLLPFKYFGKILSQLHAVSEHRQKVAKMRVPSSGKK